MAGLDLRPCGDPAETGVTLGVQVDVADAGAVAAAVTRVEDELGPVEGLVTAAGIYEMAPSRRSTTPGGSGCSAWTCPAP